MSFKNTRDNIIFGLQREEANKSIIENVFSLCLTHSKYRFQHFDFYDDVKYVVMEHKSFNMRYHIDNWSLLKTNKICNSNSLFILEFKNLLTSKAIPLAVGCKRAEPPRLNQNQQNESYELFYIQFTSKIFKTFKKEYIKYANKIHYEEFFIIPNHALTRFNHDDKIILKFKPKNNEYIKGLIDDDNKKYELYNSKTT
jgi:hypothetical protein